MMKHFKIGDKVRIRKDANTSAFAVKPGATATVIRDPYVSPYISNYVGYTQVEWDNTKKRNGQRHGGYKRDWFELVPAKRKSRATQDYKGNGNHTWEVVIPMKDHEEFSVEAMKRLRVPGGWLYADDNLTFATFVPAEHKYI